MLLSNKNILLQFYFMMTLQKRIEINILLFKCNIMNSKDRTQIVFE